MGISELVERYFDQIEIEDTDFYNSDGVDLAFLSLSIPKELLQEFLKLKGQDRNFPEVAEFWRETGLSTRLKNSDKYHGQGHEPLTKILKYLEGNIWGEYNSYREGRVILDIFEESAG